MELIVKVPGSCGELIQGYWKGEPFLVTCPIDVYSTVTLSDHCWQESLQYKVQRALKAALDYMGETEFPYSLSISSQLPQGKGMASSSADISAVLIAVAAVLGKRLTENEISVLAASIEPTDGVFCKGVAAIQYKSGQILHRYGVLPPMYIVIFDTGGMVDTMEFHARYDDVAYPDERLVEKALQWLNKPTCPKNIANAATCSALANQQVLYKPQLESLIELAVSTGALGVCNAHSGTVLGVLFSPTEKEKIIRAFIETVRIQIPSLTYLMTTTLQSGGWKLDIHK